MIQIDDVVISLDVFREKFLCNLDACKGECCLCKLGNISRAAYYKWLHREIPKSEQKNRFIADEIEKIHTDSPDKGYRRIRDDLERYHGIDVNDKRVLRICRKLNIKDVYKRQN